MTTGDGCQRAFCQFLRPALVAFDPPDSLMCNTSVFACKSKSTEAGTERIFCGNSTASWEGEGNLVQCNKIILHCNKTPYIIKASLRPVRASASKDDYK